MSDFSRNLQRLRKRAGLSQEGLAETLSVTRQTVSSWERGKSYPDLDTLLQLAEALSASPNDLLYPPEQKPRLATAGTRGFRGLAIAIMVIGFLIGCRESNVITEWETLRFLWDRAIRYWAASFLIGMVFLGFDRVLLALRERAE